MTRLLFHKSRRKAVVVTVVGFVIGAGGGLWLQYMDNDVLGWCFVITAVFVLIYGFGSLFDRRPYLILTERGITEPFSIREEIEWEAIEHADDFYYRGQYVVRLLLDRRYKAGIITPTWFWRFDRIYAREGVKALYIRTSGLEINSMRLVALIDLLRKADAAERTAILTQYRTK